MTLNNQNFEAGDEVVVFHGAIKHHFDTIASANNEEKWGPVILSKASECNNTYTPKGEKYVAHGQVLFHRDAVTFDEHGRLTAIDHDYVKERKSRVVTKEASEFKPFQRVLVRNCDAAKWQCEIFSHYEKKNKWKFICSSGSHRICIPYEGNEHLVGKVTE